MLLQYITVIAIASLLIGLLIGYCIGAALRRES